MSGALAHQGTLDPILQIPLEDELGDVLEKAMSCAGLTPEALSERSGVPVSAIMDAVDYRPELGPAECRRIAAVLGLNEVGLCALASGKYPLPDPEGLPFHVWPLRMTHGIGVVNAYIVAEADAEGGLLFDTGPGAAALESAWPPSIRGIDAVFVTHVEAEDAGGLPGVLGGVPEAGPVLAPRAPAAANPGDARGLCHARRGGARRRPRRLARDVPRARRVRAVRGAGCARGRD